MRNVVCCGLHEFGAYKHFTVLDMAKQVKSPLLPQLLEKGARPAAQCAKPAREPEEEAPCALPALPEGRLSSCCALLLDRMKEHRRDAARERNRLFRQMMLECLALERLGLDEIEDRLTLL